MFVDQELPKALEVFEDGLRDRLDSEFILDNPLAILDDLSQLLRVERERLSIGRLPMNRHPLSGVIGTAATARIDRSVFAPDGWEGVGEVMDLGGRGALGFTVAFRGGLQSSIYGGPVRSGWPSIRHHTRVQEPRGLHSQGELVLR